MAFREFLLWIIVLITLLIIVIFSLGEFKKSKKEQHFIEAMQCFESFEEELNLVSDTKRDLDFIRIKEELRILRRDYGDTLYAPIAVLISIRSFQENKDFEAVHENLSWILSQTEYGFLHYLAKLSLSSSLLDQGYYEEAIEKIENPPNSFLAIFFNQKGDILSAQGRIEEARESWQHAAKILEDHDPMLSVIQLKLNFL